MEAQSKLETTIAAEAKKPNFAKKAWGFTRRNFKKIALGTGALFLAGLIGSSYVAFKREGQTIKGQLDGRIDKSYYHKLVQENKQLGDISKIEDLIAEVYHLNTGRKIEDDFRFTVYGKKPLRVRVVELLNKNQIGGLNWGNGDLYVKDADVIGALKVIFHEPGHGRTDSITEHIGYLTKNSNKNTEPLAEKNVIDSMIALMYLEPDLGYSIYSNYITSQVSHDYLFKDNQNKWMSAINLNLLRCIEKGNLEIKEVYTDNETVKKIIEEKTKGRKNNELIAQMYEGTLDMFKQRFGDRADFNEKFEKLQKYMRYGTTDLMYSKLFVPKKDVLQKVKEKEEFLKQEHSELINDNITSSLLADYRFLDEKEKAYSITNQLINDKVKQGNLDQIPPYYLLQCLDHAVKENHKERANELFLLLKKISEKKPNSWARYKVESYEPYFQ